METFTRYLLAHMGREDSRVEMREGGGEKRIVD